MIEEIAREKERNRRHQRIRKKVIGTSEKPRLCVFRSHKHIYAQIVDDTCGKVLFSISSLSKEFKNSGKSGSNITGAKFVGEAIAQLALEKGIKFVTFDRAGYRYHGRVAVLAEAARERGLIF